MCLRVLGGQKRVPGSLELEVQAITSGHMSVLGIKLESSGSAVVHAC